MAEQAWWNVGDKIEAYDAYGTRTWRSAYIQKDAPYRGKPGAYVVWTDWTEDNPRQSWSSAGGWQPDHSIRPAPVHIGHSF